MLLCIIIPSPYNALFPAQYTLISTVIDGAHDNDAMIVSVLRGCMVLDRYTLWIIAYLSNTLICSQLREMSIPRKSNHATVCHGGNKQDVKNHVYLVML